MPHRYTHVNVTDARETRAFECDLQCQRCTATKADGTQCRRTVCIWLPYCWQHTLREFGVRVGPSMAIPGTSGLLSERRFETGSLVVPYVSESVTERVVRSRYGTGPDALGPYLFENRDAACVRGVGAAPNGAFGVVPRSAANVIFRPTSARNGLVRNEGTRYKGLVLDRSNMGVRIWAVATRTILPGEEIVADYGNDDYRDAFQNRMEVCQARGVVCDATRYVSNRRR